MSVEINTLTRNAGTTAGGVFSKTRYALANEVVLLHNLPWVVEWKCEGSFLNTGRSGGARVFTSTDVSAAYNARYIFKSNTNGIIAMGEKTNSGSYNYGIALENHGIAWTAMHTYRLENRIADDGIHPNAAGMDYITIAALETLLSECEMEVGENVAHSMTHVLTNARSSLVMSRA